MVRWSKTGVVRRADGADTPYRYRGLSVVPDEALSGVVRALSARCPLLPTCCKAAPRSSILFVISYDLHEDSMVDDLLSDAEAILKLATRPVRQQNYHDLAPLQRFYVGLLETGRLTHSKPNQPEVVMTRDLLAEAQKVWALRDLNWTALSFFLREMGCVKYREVAANGWRFQRLRDARAAWERRRGRWHWPEFGPAEWS